MYFCRFLFLPCLFFLFFFTVSFHTLPNSSFLSPFFCSLRVRSHRSRRLGEVAPEGYLEYKVFVRSLKQVWTSLERESIPLCAHEIHTYTLSLEKFLPRASGNIHRHFSDAAKMKELEKFPSNLDGDFLTKNKWISLFFFFPTVVVVREKLCTQSYARRLRNRVWRFFTSMTLVTFANFVFQPPATSDFVFIVFFFSMYYYVRLEL